ncbi:MAG: aminodeoxychorismate lyase [Pseudomonadales bacterium]|nr:aminodeoxychorismate lyase [Pseudomonadales bacterium]
MKKSWVNGAECHSVSLSDRGLAYGDGLFETILYESGSLRLLEQHLNRLGSGANQLRLPLVIETLQDELQDFLRQACQEGLIASSGKAILKVIVSRGVGGRGYSFSESNTTPQRAVLLFDHPGYPTSYREGGIQIRICDTPVSVNPAIAGLKHLNRLDSVMARNEWNNPDIKEGLMLDERGGIIEGTMSNLFIVRDNTLCTPGLRRAGVAGVMRSYILDMANQHQVETSISDNICIEQLYEADEVFVCNSIFGIWPVTLLESKRWSVGSLTKAAQSWIRGVCGD